jgi:hypothetical protein
MMSRKLNLSFSFTTRQRKERKSEKRERDAAEREIDPGATTAPEVEPSSAPPLQTPAAARRWALMSRAAWRSMEETQKGKGKEERCVRCGKAVRA